MRPDLEKMHAAINALGVVVQHLSVLGQAERNWLIRKLDDMNHSALAEHAPCPDGVENCPGDCAGERPATVPHYDTLEIAQPCPRCNGDRVVMRDKDRRTVEVVPCPRCGT